MQIYQTALITGATSGIGRAFAGALAAQGSNLILTDRRQALLEQTAAGLRAQYGVQVTVLPAELSDERDICRIEALIRATQLDLLVNNAGFGLRGCFQDGPLEPYLQMERVHIGCTVRLTYAALEQMCARDSGAIINVASDAAYMIVPANAFYSGTKAFIKQFSEGLYLDLRGRGSHVRVQALCPGLTRTDFQLKMGMPKGKQRNRGVMRWQEPETVAARSLRCLERGRPVCHCGGAMGIAERVLCVFMPRRFYYPLALRLFPVPPAA